MTFDGGPLNNEYDRGYQDGWKDGAKQTAAAERDRIIAKVPAIVQAIISDLTGRRGLGQEWEHIDPDIVQEIVEEWKRLAADVIKEADDE